MKNKFIICVAFLLVNVSISFAQKIQASLGVGSAPNRVKIYLKSAVNIASTNISTLQFNLAVSTSISPAPTATIVSNNVGTISATGYSVSTAVESNFLHFMILNAGSVNSFPMTAGVDFEAMEINFSGGPIAVQSISLVTLPDGGSGATNGNALFYATGSQFTDGNDLYYTRPGVTVLNGPSYRPNSNVIDGVHGSFTSTATISNVSLPTKFSNFFAIKKDDNADLTWTVENEESNSYFDVQRSTDGRVFNDVIRVQALRNGRSSNTYTTPDVNISRIGSKVLYYRIKQVETSGEVVYSEVRQINLSTKNFTIGLYPNPVVSSTKLVIDAPEAGKAFVIVRDALGKTVQQINMEFVKGVNQKDLNATMLPAGEYNVSVVGATFTQTIKMTKTN